MSEINLRKVLDKDIDIIFKWQNKKKIRKFSFNTTSPTIEEHRKWFLSKVNSSIDLFYIIIYKKKECGVVRFDYNPKLQGYILSWYLDPDYHGIGIGTNALILALKEIKILKVIAMVHPENLASIKSLIKAGFIKIKDNYYEFKSPFGDLL